MERPRYAVAKAGGSMTANAEALRRTADIVSNDPSIKTVVVSAPGKLPDEPTKVTDILLAPFNEKIPKDKRPTVKQSFDAFRRRVEKIDLDLGTHVLYRPMHDLADRVHHGDEFTEAEFAELGEMSSALLLGGLVNGNVVDPKQLVRLREGGKLDKFEYDVFTRLLNLKPGNDVKNIVGGFSYSDHNGKAVLMPRNGSDIMGAIIAAKTHAIQYDNIKDTGVRAASPSYVANARIIAEMTYDEMYEAMVSGDPVLHPLAVALLNGTGIPTHVYNGLSADQSRDDVKGTWIRAQREIPAYERVIGIFGRSGYDAYKVQKAGLNNIKGAGQILFGILSGNDISYERSADQGDAITAIVSQADTPKMSEALKSVNKAFDGVKVRSTDMGIISCIGEGLVDDNGRINHAAEGALLDAGIPIVMNTWGPMRTSFTIAVPSEQTGHAIQVLYDTLIGQ